jgi:hypothetical protein
MGKKSLFSWSVWAGIATSLWVIAFLIAESVPIFNDLLGITSALFASWFTYGLPGIFWLYMNKELFTMNGQWTWKKGMLTSLNILNVIVGAMIVRDPHSATPFYVVLRNDYKTDFWNLSASLVSIPRGGT